MRCRICTTRVAPLCTLTLIAGQAWSQPNGASFQGLGDLPGGTVYSVARAVSRDGTTAVGHSGATSSGSHAFRWTQATGIVSLGALPGGPIPVSQAWGVSDDGSVIVGESFSVNGSEAFRWENGVMIGLGDLPGGFFSSSARAVSADGSIIVGIGSVPVPGNPTLGMNQAVRWEAGGMTNLGNSVGSSSIQDLSSDALIAAGASTVSLGQPNDAALWSPALILLPSSTASATAISSDGSIVVGFLEGGGGFRWSAAGGLDSIGGTGARGVSDNGDVVVGSMLVSDQPRAFIWDAVNGTRDLKTVLETEYGLNLSGWTLYQASDVSGDGRTIVGEGLHSGVTEGWIAVLPDPDTDGDGLLDSWETDGIPYTDALGQRQLYLLDVDGDGNSDADPNHIDLFVEIDAMNGLGLAPSLTDLNPVIAAFANAPITNPDLTTGVQLHLHIDELTIAVAPMPSPWVEFDALKTQVASGTNLPGYFGPVDDRNHADGAARLEARRKAFRYCLFGSTILGDDTSGKAELAGNDFIVSLGAWVTPGGTSAEKAGTFMHELGHTLGLGHGGRDPATGLIDSANYKPNYYSVMNYGWQVPFPWHAPNSWPLMPGRPGYSKTNLIDLNEAALAECVGVFAPFELFDGIVIAHNTNPPGDPVSLTYNWACCDINWNGDSTTSCLSDPVAVDLNHWYARDAATPGEVLKGHEDWSQLVYDFKTSSDFADGVHQTTIGQPPEMTSELKELLAELLPPFCTGDINLDRAVDVDDLLRVINEWGRCAEGCTADIAPIGFADGQVNVDDLLTVINGWGDCE